MSRPYQRWPVYSRRPYHARPAGARRYPRSGCLLPVVLATALATALIRSPKELAA
jgi:hypothetical protein